MLSLDAHLLECDQKFFFSTFFDVGNGGVLQRPAANYKEINEKIKSGEMEPGFSEPDDIMQDQEQWIQVKAV